MNKMTIEARNPRPFDYCWRELAFKLFCRHRQGKQPNILMYCLRRGGSTWLLNSLSAHDGMRYVNRPLMSALWSRHCKRMPDLNAAYSGPNLGALNHLISLRPEDESRFECFAEEVFYGETEVYPSLNFRAPYFRRKTNRIAFQMTSGMPLIEWFDRHLDVATLILFRHPISNALSIMQADWKPACHEFVYNDWFRENYLNQNLIDLSESILKDGSLLEQHVLDWALKMLVPFRAYNSGNYPDWTFLTYEQAVMEPSHVVKQLATRFSFEHESKIFEQLHQPSRSVSRNTADKINDKEYLLNRWRKQVSEGEAKAALSIPEAFGIDVYSSDSELWNSRYSL